MIRLWEEIQLLKPLTYLAWAPILWALDRIKPEGETGT
ncbi:hypothetical protein QFZ50_001756 [Arthrobacter agilis]|nr:hypothetical protein [Arthrobacter agilis]